jgi:hypothetical protein
MTMSCAVTAAGVPLHSTLWPVEIIFIEHPRVLSNADPLRKAKIYADIGSRLIYHRQNRKSWSHLLVTRTP